MHEHRSTSYPKASSCERESGGISQPTDPDAEPEGSSKGETADPQPPTDSGWAKAYGLPSDMDPMFSMYL